MVTMIKRIALLLSFLLIAEAAAKLGEDRKLQDIGGGIEGQYVFILAEGVDPREKAERLFGDAPVPDPDGPLLLLAFGPTSLSSSGSGGSCYGPVQILHYYSVINGFAARGISEEMISVLEQDPEIVSITQVGNPWNHAVVVLLPGTHSSCARSRTSSAGLQQRHSPGQPGVWIDRINVIRHWMETTSMA